MRSYWAVSQTFSGREHLARREIEKANHGAFVPTYRRIWSVDGKLCVKVSALYPGYDFFKTEPDGWGAVGAIEGCRVLSDGAGNAKRVPDEDIARIFLESATGLHDKIELPAHCIDGQTRRKQRRRRPRKSRRARSATAV